MPFDVHIFGDFPREPRGLEEAVLDFVGYQGMTMSVQDKGPGWSIYLVVDDHTTRNMGVMLLVTFLRHWGVTEDTCLTIFPRDEPVAGFKRVERVGNRNRTAALEQSLN